MRLFGLLPLLLLAACAAARPQPASVRIENVTLLDGRGGAPVTQAWVEVRGDRIAALGTGTPPRRAVDTRIDGRGKWLLPGFTDMHAHLLLPRCRAAPDGSPIFDRTVSEAALSAMLDFGITTVRSPATPTVEGLALRDHLNAGRVRGPFAFASAEFINDAKASGAELRALVRDALPHRPDFIKAYSALPPASVAILIEEAHRHGLPVIGHLQRTSWAEGLRLGVDQLTHAVDWSEETLPAAARSAYREALLTRRGFASRIDWLELLDLDDPAFRTLAAELARRRVPVDPTLIAYDAKFSPPDSPRYRADPHVGMVPELLADWRECSADPTGGWTADDRRRWAAARPKLLSAVRRYHEAGVLLTAGTDFTNPWIIAGEGLHQEIELLAEAGIPNLAILRMTGANAAEALRSPDIGIVAPGRRADLVLLAADPAADIRNTRSILWVMKSGAIVSTGIPPRPPTRDDARSPAQAEAHGRRRSSPQFLDVAAEATGDRSRRQPT